MHELCTNFAGTKKPASEAYILTILIHEETSGGPDPDAGSTERRQREDKMKLIDCALLDDKNNGREVN